MIDCWRYGVGAVTGGAVTEDADLQTLRFFRRRPVVGGFLVSSPPTAGG